MGLRGLISLTIGPVSQLRLLLLLPLCLALAGCETLGYYSQAIAGQLSIIGQRQSIDRLIAAPGTDEKLRDRLQLLVEILAFAEDELRLPVEDQYSHFVDLRRESVVWNVFAAPELSLEPKTWCYPIAGCAAYRGYFSETSAHSYAAQLRGRGWETHVGGVAAYSTLGWLNDPVLNTFVYRDESQFADLIFHELAHQRLYLPGDTLFNESFATAVAAEGVRRWMQRKNDTRQYDLYLQARLRQADFVALVGRYREILAALYESDASADDKRHRRDESIEQLRRDFRLLQQQWGDLESYSAWVAGPINNAKLNSVGFYFGLVPALERLLAELGGDLPGFYRRCEQLESLDPPQRLQHLEATGD